MSVGINGRPVEFCALNLPEMPNKAASSTDVIRLFVVAPFTLRPPQDIDPRVRFSNSGSTTFNGEVSVQSMACHYGNWQRGNTRTYSEYRNANNYYYDLQLIENLCRAK